MQKKVAVILSGIGVLDGSEVTETISALIAIEKYGATYQAFAPNLPQKKTMNYCSGTALTEQRSILLESARLVRGNCLDLKKLSVDDYDAVLLPGGFGAVMHLSDFEEKKSECTILPELENCLLSFKEQKKPAGFMCISPVIAARVYAAPLRCTIGSDPVIAAEITRMGATHVPCAVDEVVADPECKVVSTPAYMLASSMFEVFVGVDKLVKTLLTW